MLRAAPGLVGWEVMVAAPSWVPLCGVCGGMGMTAGLAASLDWRSCAECPQVCAWPGLTRHCSLSAFHSPQCRVGVQEWGSACGLAGALLHCLLLVTRQW